VESYGMDYDIWSAVELSPYHVDGHALTSFKRGCIAAVDSSYSESVTVLYEERCFGRTNTMVCISAMFLGL